MTHDYIRIDDHDLDELLSALRRHHRTDAVRILALWARDEPEFEWDAEYDDDPPDEPERLLEHELTAWIHGEIAAHVEEDRFEHALCLVERYRPPLSSAEHQARIGSAARLAPPSESTP